MACTWSSSSSWCSRSRPECGPGLETGGTVLTSGAALPVTNGLKLRRWRRGACAHTGRTRGGDGAAGGSGLGAALASPGASVIVGGVGGGRVGRTVCAASVPTRVRVRTRVGLESGPEFRVVIRLFDRISDVQFPVSGRPRFWSARRWPQHLLYALIHCRSPLLAPSWATKIPTDCSFPATYEQCVP
jgi:hypothetical protein